MLTLRRNNTDERALSGWGITAATLTYRSQAADDLTLTCAGDALADPVFADGDTLDLYDSGVRLFSGRLQTNPRYGSAAREGHTFTAEGGFWWLDACTYEQAGRHYNEDDEVVTIASSHIVLNCGSNYSAHISVAAQITGAVNYAISAYAAPLQLAELTGFGRIAPIEEAMDLSCGEVVRRELRWAPDSVTWVDYTTTPPTLHCAQLQPDPLPSSPAQRQRRQPLRRRLHRGKLTGQRPASKAQHPGKGPSRPYRTARASRHPARHHPAESSPPSRDRLKMAA